MSSANNEHHPKFKVERKDDAFDEQYGKMSDEQLQKEIESSGASVSYEPGRLRITKLDVLRAVTIIKKEASEWPEVKGGFTGTAHLDIEPYGLKEQESQGDVRCNILYKNIMFKVRVFVPKSLYMYGIPRPK